jgi:hypothetical protein
MPGILMSVRVMAGRTVVDDFQGGGCIFRRMHRVPQVGQGNAQHFADAGFVVHQKDVVGHEGSFMMGK